MIEYNLTENDQKVLDEVRRQALICREHARYYDEHEEEFAPDELEEAKDYPDPWSIAGNRTEEDTGLGVMSMLVKQLGERGLLGHGAGHLVLELAVKKAIPVREAGLALMQGRYWEEFDS